MSRQQEVNTPVRSPEVFAPAMFTSAAWDILLALFAARRRELTLGRLGALCGIPQNRLPHLLANLVETGFIVGYEDAISGDVCTVLTRPGRDQLHAYLLAAGNLQIR